MNRHLFFTLIAVAAGLTAHAVHGASLLPTDDGFGYQFLGTTPLNGSPPFSEYLPAGATTTGHNTKSALRFDLSGVGLGAADVTSATLSLYVIDTTVTGFGASPAPASPIVVSLFALGAGIWDEATLTYDNMPSTTGPAYDSISIDGVDQSVSFDVTALVKDWLDGSVANNGLALVVDVPVGALPNWVYAVFSSSESQTSPELTVVPEPASALIAFLAVPALVWFGRCRIESRK